MYFSHWLKFPDHDFEQFFFFFFFFGGGGGGGGGNGERTGDGRETRFTSPLLVIMVR